ncbi:hypothetical protein [Aurantibacter sp.]|uniref:hypothetical protein n=1 Tax=Aurantibacter sp. TaxID=2807103 RepID=UPI0032635A04
MLDILKSNFFVVLYAITWALSILKLPKYFDSTLKYFPIIIGYTLCTEILGALIRSVPDFTLFSDEKYASYTLLIYNIYDLFFFTFFFFVYWKSIKAAKYKTLIKYGACIYLICLAINAILVNPMLFELWHAYVLGSLFLITICITYLYQLWQQNKLIDYASNLLFWISIGLIIFHLGYAPITVFKNLNLSITSNEFNMLRSVHISLIIIMYTSFIVGLIKMKRYRH